MTIFFIILQLIGPKGYKGSQGDGKAWSNELIRISDKTMKRKYFILLKIA